MRVQASSRMRRNAPGTWWMPQSAAPEMKTDGTSIRHPLNSRSSAAFPPPVWQRYHYSPPWKPVRAYSAA